MPEGRRRVEKMTAVERLLSLFSGRVLSFDVASTPFYATAVTIRRKAAKSIDAF